MNRRNEMLHVSHYIVDALREMSAQAETEHPEQPEEKHPEEQK